MRRSLFGDTGMVPRPIFPLTDAHRYGLQTHRDDADEHNVEHGHD